MNVANVVFSLVEFGGPASLENTKKNKNHQLTDKLWIFFYFKIFENLPRFQAEINNNTREKQDDENDQRNWKYQIELFFYKIKNNFN